MKIIYDTLKLDDFHNDSSFLHERTCKIKKNM